MYTSTCTGESGQTHAACRVLESGGTSALHSRTQGQLWQHGHPQHLTDLIFLRGSNIFSPEMGDGGTGAPAGKGSSPACSRSCPGLPGHPASPWGRPGQPAAQPRKAFPHLRTGHLGHPTGNPALTLPYCPPEGGFQRCGADVQDVHLGKARVNAANLPGGKQQQCLVRTVVRTAHTVQAGKGQGAGPGCRQGARVSLSLRPK